MSITKMSRPYPEYLPTKPYPAVTDKLLQQLVERILLVGEPHRIVLFGSRARGDHKPDSDLDLLIIERSHEQKEKKRNRYQEALRGSYPEITTIVYSLRDIEEWKYVPSHILSVAIAQGHVLYEEKTSYQNDAELVALVREGIQRKTPADLAKQWFERGDEELGVAMLTVANGHALSTACFLCQQAAEKYLKGFLSYHSVIIQKTHDLEALANHVCKFRDIPQLRDLALKTLSEYAISGRYDLNFHPEETAAEEAVQAALEIRKLILAHTPDETHPSRRQPG